MISESVGSDDIQIMTPGSSDSDASDALCKQVPRQPGSGSRVSHGHGTTCSERLRLRLLRSRLSSKFSRLQNVLRDYQWVRTIQTLHRFRFREGPLPWSGWPGFATPLLPRCRSGARIGRGCHVQFKMADAVQQILESMVPELHELVDKNVLSKVLSLSYEFEIIPTYLA